MPRQTDEVLEALRVDGIAKLAMLPAEQTSGLVAHLTGCQVYDAHVRAKSKRAAAWGDARAEQWPMFCSDMRDVVMAPFLFEAALATYDIAKAYFEEEPLLYSMNAFWTQPSGQVYQDTHSWHRDGDDRKQLVLFVYGSHVLGAAGGAHHYQRGSHRIADDALGRPFQEPPPEVIATVLGAAGTMFLVDTSGLHFGQRPAHGCRMLAWARWGVSDPPASYGWDELSPLPAHRLGARFPTDPGLQRAIHLIAR